MMDIVQNCKGMDLLLNCFNTSWRRSLIIEISDYFIKQDSIAYELGCSTGILSYKLSTSIYVATIPIFVFGGFIKLYLPGFSDSFLRSNLSIAVVSILMSIIIKLTYR